MLMFESWQNRERRGERGIKKQVDHRGKQERDDKLRGGGVNKGKKRGRVFVTDGRTVGWDEEQGRKGGKIPDLLQCDPVIWGVGVATEAVRHSDAGVWVTEAAGAWAWGTKHQQRTHVYDRQHSCWGWSSKMCRLAIIFHQLSCFQPANELLHVRLHNAQWLSFQWLLPHCLH